MGEAGVQTVARHSEAKLSWPLRRRLIPGSAWNSFQKHSMCPVLCCFAGSGPGKTPSKRKHGDSGALWATNSGLASGFMILVARLGFRVRVLGWDGIKWSVQTLASCLWLCDPCQDR